MQNKTPKVSVMSTFNDELTIENSVKAYWNKHILTMNF